jgi:hypothetical protein
MAVTRAHSLLIVVGDPQVMVQVPIQFFSMFVTPAQSLLIVVGDPHVLVQVS